jgi:predicted DNA-binding transcriptional regulator AlpA
MLNISRELTYLADQMQSDRNHLKDKGENRPLDFINRNDERLLNARQVAQKLGVSERFIRDHTTRRSPRIPGVKMGKLLRYRAGDVDDFMSKLNTLPSSRRA